MAAENKSTTPRPRLGRGLSSLISNSISSPPDGQYESHADPAGRSDLESASPSSAAQGVPVEIPMDDIGPNPYQPRRQFLEAELAELADSIRQQGIIQPLVVAPSDAPASGHAYTLVAGERRLRAARRTGLQAVPCVVRQATAQQMLEWALVENIQRTDLNPLERARAYREYLDRFSLTHADGAERLGQKRTTVTNYLRILELQDEVQGFVGDGALSFGHAKVLAGLIDHRDRQVQLAQRAVSERLSVRELERLAGASPAGEGSVKPKAESRPGKPPYIQNLEEQLTSTVGTRVTVHPGRARHTGRISVEYYSLEDFDRITATLGLKLES